MSVTAVGDGPGLVCLPGGPGFGGAQLGTLGGLAATRTLLRLDLRGAGASVPPADESWSIDAYAADVEAFRQEAGFEAIDLFGHSHGGLVAARYAARYGHVRRLVLDGVPMRREDIAFPASMAGYFHSAGPATERYLAESLSAPYEPAARWWAEHEFGVQDVRSDLPSIVAPALVISGHADFACGPSFASLMAALLPAGRTALINGAGHFAWVEQPRRYAEVVEDFLAN